MADIAISYSHRNAEAATDLRRHVLARGFTVWMDEPDEGDTDVEGIAIPWGQEHWEVISREFSRADAVVVVDTADWRASEYCRKEYRFLTEWGKWIPCWRPFLDDPCADPGHLHYRGFDEIESELTDRRALLSAHARLVQIARGTVTPGGGSRAERMLRRSESRDARLVLDADLRSAELAANGAVIAAAQDALSAARAARRKLTRAGVSAIVVLAVLAAGGAAGWQIAEAAKRSAEDSADRSVSLDLASRALATKDTADAIHLAEQAVDRNDTARSSGALSVARARDRRLRTLTIPTRDYTGAVLAAATPTLVAYTSDELQWIDARTGNADEAIAVPEAIRIGAVAVSADGKTAAYLARNDRTLQIVSRDGVVRSIDGMRGIGLSTGNGRSLWRSTEGGDLVRTRFPPDDGLPAELRIPLPDAATSFTVDSATGTVDFIDEAGTLHSGTLDLEPTDDVDAVTDRADGSVGAPLDRAADYTEDWSRPLVEKPIRDPLRQANSTIVRCGRNLYGAVLTSRITGVRFSDVDGVFSTRRTAFPMSTPACGPGDVGWGTSLTRGRPSALSPGQPAPVLPAGALRYILAVDTTRTRHLVVTTDGRLIRIPADYARSWDQPGADSMLALPAGDLIIKAEDGAIIDTATGERTGTIGGQLIGWSNAVLGDTGAVYTDDGLVLVGHDGRPHHPIPVGGGRAFSSLHAGADREHFVVVGGGVVTLVRTEGSVDAVIDPSAVLDDGDSVSDADISPDGTRLALTSALGRLVTVEVPPAGGRSAPSTAVEWAHRLPAGTGTKIAYVPATGNIVAAGQDGVLHLLRAHADELSPVATTTVGGAPGTLQTRGSLIMVAAERTGVFVFSGTDLRMHDALRPGIFEAHSPRLSTEHGQIRGLSVYDAAGDGASVEQAVGDTGARDEVVDPESGLTVGDLLDAPGYLDGAGRSSIRLHVPYFTGAA